MALKILHPEFLESVAADRFLREIRLVSQLNHPHIARLLASGERKWLVHITMEFIDGASLRDVLGRDRRLSVGDTLRLACDLLDALDHAHRLGIVHRDVKPENVIISPGRGAVLLDFGIARAVVTSATDEITRTGMTVGSSAYMSPEQINADHTIDGRSDLYSLGCVLFECLAGRPPFVWRKEIVVLQLHLTEPVPDVRTFRPDVPPDLAEAINTALAKQTGGAMAIRRGNAGYPLELSCGVVLLPRNDGAGSSWWAIRPEQPRDYRASSESAVILPSCPGNTGR